MKTPVISGKELVKILVKNGFEIVGRKGSHVRLKKKSFRKSSCNSGSIAQKA